MKLLGALCTYQTGPEKKGAGQSDRYPARQFTGGSKIMGKMWLVIRLPHAKEFIRKSSAI